MIRLRKLKEDDQVIVYEYIPEDEIENGKGTITFNKNNIEVLEFSLSEIEKGKCLMLYRDKAVSIVRRFIENQEYPDKYLLAWY
ncbi:hypothetical protein [Staphylococcus pasteuri]|uniref:hypothetical protein n=2 Tax=Staphylococcus pasteuri TaxID=45972 RepID=UPI000D3DB271|nr:hypothetical protein [Staphylococcus pasteuri]MCE3021444.1 hypothetical protein [Staphylococcus pasteuri]MCT1925719.1 hypothetical protein [Staphylococcus pasteuri]PTU83109.1 hypothetical protein BUZ62_12345 [Staphylococcus pasteuri]QQT11278.1 hypothetical protein I6J09_00620 [Staphylococcus pasteuri]